ncbi:MAG: DNA repair protein RadC [bacterium]
MSQIDLYPSKIKDIERLQRYEHILNAMLQNNRFSKADIYKCRESKQLIGKVINTLVSEGALIRKTENDYQWVKSEKEKYKTEWQNISISRHQLKRLAKEDRPREKLLILGPSKLTVSELLAIFLRTGAKGKSAIHLANELLTKFGGVRGIFEASDDELLNVKGLGKAKIAQIKAVYGLSEHYLQEKIKARKIVRNSKEIYDYLYHTMRDKKDEVFKILCLNGQNELLNITDAFFGTVTSSNIYPRKVIELAIKNNATALIFVHNHPSGNPNPSKYDKKITKELLFACRYAGIRIWEHIIIGDNCYYSFADESLIDEYDREFEGVETR